MKPIKRRQLRMCHSRSHARPPARCGRSRLPHAPRQDRSRCSDTKRADHRILDLHRRDDFDLICSRMCGNRRSSSDRIEHGEHPRPERDAVSRARCIAAPMPITPIRIAIARVIASCALHRLDDLLRGVIEIVRRGHVEIGLGDDLLAQIHIGAFEPHHQRHAQADVAHRGDHAFRDDVALHDAAEDVDQDALHLRIGGDDLERRRHLLGGGAAADVEEVRGLLAVELDDVHGRHREPGAVDHAADGAVERHVVEVVFRRLDLLVVLFGEVAQRHDVGMAEQRVVVEADLGVEADELVVLGDDQRIDLEQAHVLLGEGLVEPGEQPAHLLLQIAGEVQRLRRCGARGAGRCRSPDRRRW